MGNVFQRKKGKTRQELNDEGRAQKKSRKHKGYPAGSRHNADGEQTLHVQQKMKQDARIGSKKSIPLLSSSELKPKVNSSKLEEKSMKLTPQQELDQLENDSRLDALLEKEENGEKLTFEEQRYVDNCLDRIDLLMTELGIEYEDDEPDEASLDKKNDDIMALLKRRS